jgi:hypothetical protein
VLRFGGERSVALEKARVPSHPCVCLSEPMCSHLGGDVERGDVAAFLGKVVEHVGAHKAQVVAVEPHVPRAWNDAIQLHVLPLELLVLLVPASNDLLFVYFCERLRISAPGLEETCFLLLPTKELFAVALWRCIRQGLGHTTQTDSTRRGHSFEHTTPPL